MVTAMAPEPRDPSDARAPEPRGPDDDDDEPGWVGLLVSAGGAVGMNQMRLRWKLRRWVRRRREDRNRVVAKAVHLGYQHRVCGHCTAVNDRGETTCSRCGRPLAARSVEMARRLGLWVPNGTMTTLLALAMVAVFVAMMIAQASGMQFELPPWLLIAHGANLPGSSEPVRDLTSLLVHGGLFHVVIAAFTVAMVGGLLEREVGPPLVIPIFLVTGGFGAAASDWLGREGLGVGAAAGVVGLIGAGAIIGQRAGIRRGITYRNELLSVGVLVVGFGFFVDTDYRALVPAAALGVVIGWLLPRTAIAARPWLTRLIGAAGALALIAIAVVSIGQMVTSPATGRRPLDLEPGYQPLPYAARFEPWSRDPGDPDDVAMQYVACEAVARDAAAGIALFDDVEGARATCARLDALRRECPAIEAAPAPYEDDPMRQYRLLDCKTVREIDKMLATDMPR